MFRITATIATVSSRKWLLRLRHAGRRAVCGGRAVCERGAPRLAVRRAPPRLTRPAHGLQVTVEQPRGAARRGGSQQLLGGALAETGMHLADAGLDGQGWAVGQAGLVSRCCVLRRRLGGRRLSPASARQMACRRAELTLEQDLIDLASHQKEAQRRSSFAYVVMRPDERVQLGCVHRPVREGGL